MLKRYKSKAFVWGISGIILQMLGIIGMLSETTATEEMDPKFAAALFIVMGTALLFFGLTFYCRAKARKYAWALTAFASLPGFLFVHFLPDKEKSKKRK